MRTSKTMVVAFWIVTVLFCVEMIFTAYWEWFTPQAAQAFARLGFPAASFRVELSVAKLLGVLALLIPAIPGRVKEWAYAGFAFNLLSALIAHASIYDRHAAFAPSTITLSLGTCSYVLWRRLESLRRAPVRAL
ncbi:MAG TPA: DoxX family protein [Edaphobacter sp.]|uniref:DoxX family protein n=1 Tax=Edaphobacter sp. TaxID=1934404 RepID=UPI002D099784|nr:DoxX family protein [Edaphobacter sp.]HUZ95944.1 DoxX family protein [Edaphobacter sp.]